jgi:ABC-type xylose transport system substrate-binding protein
MAIKIANGEKPENTKTLVNNGIVDVPSLLLEPVVVDKSNLREIIVNGGVYTEQEVYGE